MVVDDDRLIRELTVTALTYCVNREVKFFDSGLSALDYIREDGDADIILANTDLSGMDGFELMARVKKIHPKMIFILMSDHPKDEIKSRMAGAQAFLSRPFEINDLFNIVQCFVVEGAKE